MVRWPAIESRSRDRNRGSHLDDHASVRSSRTHPVDDAEALFARIANPVAKYWVTKCATAVVREALECIGGNGYVEESILPRLYRESPLNSIWEGSGNVIALDVIRAMMKSPAAVEVFMSELDRCRGRHPVLDRHLRVLRDSLSGPAPSEVGARRLTERMATVWAACLLAEHGHSAVAKIYLQSRLGGDWGSEFGTLPPSTDLDAVARRTVPAT